MLALALLFAQAGFDRPATRAATAPRAAAPLQGEVEANGFFSVDKAQQGSTFQGAVVLEIPGGLHVNSNRPLGKYTIPTVLRVEAPRGFRVGPVAYPRARVRAFRFGEGAPEERLSVYEGRAVMRFNVSVPAGAEQGLREMRLTLRYQSCSDTVCFPPATRELRLPIAVVGAGAPVRRINGQYFGGGARARRR